MPANALRQYADIGQQPLPRNALTAFLQGASNAFASNVSGPVDLISWGLRKAGVPVPQNAVGSSQWMQDKGFTAPVEQSAASLAGETIGLTAPIAAAAKAPQIAAGLLSLDDAAKAQIRQRLESYMVRNGLRPGVVAPKSKAREALDEFHRIDNEILNSAPVPEYGGSHRPVTVDGGAARLYDLEPAFGADIYGKNAAQFYGTGDRRMDAETLRVLNSVRGNPNATVTVYRAIPKNAEAKALNPGDWVTVNKSYAKAHGDGALGGEYRIIEQRVPASSLTTNADSFHEQGYYP